MIGMVIINDNFWPDDISDELKNAIITKQPTKTDVYGLQVKTYNIRCLDPRFTNILDWVGYSSDIPFGYLLICGSEENKFPIGTFVFAVTNKDYKIITSDNYQEYADVQFEISMP